MRRVCVFCGSSPGNDPIYVDAARRFGKALADSGHGLVYGGGNVGLMGAVADAALAAGGEVIGVIPRRLAVRELAHYGVTELRVVETMHERKSTMAELAGAFVALPGGIGTMDEFCEVLTWVQLSIHRKPCGLLNLAGYYEPFLALLERFRAEGFLHAGDADLVIVRDDPEDLLAAVAAAAASAPQFFDRALP